ncbi:polyamine aminopropyl transferase [Salix suchowensis]|nr:polyamine aminopropyl transferase [Salix suchowensis]
MISLFSATNPLMTWSPSSTPARTSCSQTHRWFCTSSRTTNALSFHIPFSLTCSRLTQKPNAHATTTLQVKGCSSDSKKEEQEEEYKVLTAVKSQYNDILIVDTPKTRMLLLDSTHNVHSLLYKDGQKWTRSYWDEFASLPAIIPQGPVAIFGLGGGTAAHLMLDVWPSLQLEGWEIDEILINKARDYFGLSDLEKQTQAGGILHVVVGDALCSLEDDSRKYAGIVIDLFYGGKVLPQLQDVATWLELKGRLIPNGRLMVNCGGIEESDAINERISTKSVDNAWVENPTIKVLCEAFPGQLSWKRMPEGEGANYLALTGPLPDLTSWSAMVPHHLSATVSKWRPCSPLI